MNAAAGDHSKSGWVQPARGSNWMMIFFILIGLVFSAVAVICVGLASIPLENLREYGRFVRRPDDVTPERFERFQQFCWFAAASTGSVGVGLILRRRMVRDFLSGVLRTTTEALPLPQAAATADDEACWPGWLALILFVGAMLRLSLLWNSMAYDESYSWVNFASRPLLQALGDLNSTNNHVLNTICMYFTSRLFGPQEWALRLGAMTFGMAMLPFSFVWARRWLGTATALLTTALLAVSPPLVTYSADARGYMYVTVAAMLLDDAFAKISERSDGRERSWLQAGAVVIVGVWSMIIMGYAIMASSIWYLFSGGGAPTTSTSISSPDADAHDRRERAPSTGLVRLRQLVVLAWLTAIGSSLLYIPGYICRGTLFLNDPVMQKSTVHSSEFLNETAHGLVVAFGLWTEGGVPAWVVGVGALVGLWCWPRDRQSALRLWMPFLVMVVMNLARHVNPPQRIYLWLMPWVSLLCSHGLVSIARFLRLRTWGMCGIVLMTLGLGLWHWATHWPVLFHPSERISYVSVPDVVRRLHQEVMAAPDDLHRLIAPLPCDLPAIFYMDRAGFRVPLNDRPQRGEHVWLIARHHETPSDVLEEGLVGLHGWQDRFTPWQHVEHYKTLDLYSARVLPTTAR